MSGELLKECERLTLKEKVELRERLSDMIKSTGSGRSPLRCSMLLGDMAAAMGWQTVPYNSREAQYVWARAIVAWQMCREGYSTGEIGRQMMKDHSTIIHLRNKMQDVFDMPQMYEDVLDMWDKFKRKIDNEIHTGTTENPVGLGGELSDGNEGAMGQESGEDGHPDNL